MQYNFEWDVKKAKANLIKHSISFEYAVNVFRDPKAITIYDKGRESEDRWVTIGITSKGNILVVSHTYQEIDKGIIMIRIISSRKATKREEKQYSEE